MSEMRARGAVVGGEGNGGVIVPAAHYGRDSLVAVALVCQALSSSGLGVRQMADRLPRLVMVKEKFERSAEPWERAVERLTKTFPDYHAESADGLRLSRGEDWVHVRPSGTEPVVRVIAESPLDARARELVGAARQALLGTS